MNHRFWKYQGTGNDFIIFDGRDDISHIKDNKELIARLCDRRFGIGADGLIIIEGLHDGGVDFKMVYYNADGAESTMCGNGGRCSIAFAHLRGFSGVKTNFIAVDGEHLGMIGSNGMVELGMIDVGAIKRLSKHTFEINTGSPHYVYFADEGEEMDIVAYGKRIRYSDVYFQGGINVNVVRKKDGVIDVSTYERGVEDETLSCGTGVTASAIAYFEMQGGKGRGTVDVITKGGHLKVTFIKEGGIYKEVVLSGPATLVFEGTINI